MIEIPELFAKEALMILKFRYRITLQVLKIPLRQNRLLFRHQGKVAGTDRKHGPEQWLSDKRYNDSF